MINIRLFCNIIVSILALVFTGCGMHVIEDLPTYEESSLVKEGDNAPLFSTTLLDGTAVSLADYRGEYMMLILFSHTCPDCKMLLDELQGLINSEVPMPSILAVGRDATEEELREYSAAAGYTVAMVADADRRIFNLYATTYVPRVYLIDALGTVAMLKIEYSHNTLTELIEYANSLSN